MSDPTIPIKYHQGLERLEKLLSGVDRPGDFYVHGTLEVPLPKVTVEGVGVLSFPLPETQARALIAQANRAPYGRGEETLLDTSVRKVWQLAPERVQISGKSWPQTLETILAQVSTGLGCQKTVVSAELYKLLVYDEGSFFVAHRDTEKSDGMFGTLVVTLPSLHSGGELVLRHGGREVTVDMSQAEVSELAFAAFYADCEHEVRPITRGNRVCLVYNLIQKRSKKGRQESLTAPAYGKETVAAAALIQETMDCADAPAKLVWLLEHQYSPASLAFAGLKNADAALAKVLSEAARQARCDVHLAMVHIEESGSAEGDYESYGRSRRRRYSNEDDEDYDESASFEVIEVHESSQHVDEWVNLQDHKVRLGKIPLADGELLPQGSLDDEDPDEQRFMEATGNEGASFERSYHRAALVLWRPERLGDLRLQAGVGAAFPHFKKLVRRTEVKSATPAVRREAVEFAARMLSSWENAEPNYSLYQEEDRPARDAMLTTLCRLGDVGLVERFSTSVLGQEYDGSENEALLAAARFLGPAKSGTILGALAAKKMPTAPRECLNLLLSLIEAHGSARDSEWSKPLHHLAATVTEGFKSVCDPEAMERYERWGNSRNANPVDGKLVADWLTALEKLNADDLGEAATAIISARPEVFDPNTVLVPALNNLNESRSKKSQPTAAWLRLWKQAVEFLLARSESPPQPSPDWRLDVRLNCHCKDCGELEAFARDPVSQVHRFRAREDRRQHVRYGVPESCSDIDFVTDRTGSPQTLVCTKTRRSFLERCKQYKQDIKSLKTLAKLAATLPAQAAGKLHTLTKRIKSAVDKPK